MHFQDCASKQVQEPSVEKPRPGGATCHRVSLPPGCSHTLLYYICHFCLHGQDFKIQNFTVKYVQFFTFNLENLTPDILHWHRPWSPRQISGTRSLGPLRIIRALWVLRPRESRDEIHTEILLGALEKYSWPYLRNSKNFTKKSKKITQKSKNFNNIQINCNIHLGSLRSALKSGYYPIVC